MAPSLFKYTAFLVFISYILGGAALVKAVPIKNIYSASVPIASQFKQDRLRGFDEALNLVLVKASGQFNKITQSDTIKLFLPAEPYVQTFSYRENPAYQLYLEQQSKLSNEEIDGSQVSHVDAETPGLLNEGGRPEGMESSETQPLPYLLDVTFAPSIVEEKMARYNVPVWGSERPSVLVWIVSESLGERSIVGASDMGELTERLLHLGHQRAVPLYLPVADLQDASAIDVDDVWGLYPESVEEASERYRPDAVAMLRVYQSANGKWSGNWLLNLKQNIDVGEINDSTLSELFAALVTDIAEKLSSHYAVTIVPGEDGSVLDLEVDQINTFTDYIEIQKYLANLPPVSSIQMKWVRNGKAGFLVQLIGAKNQFFQHIDLGGRLKKDIRTRELNDNNLDISHEAPELEEMNLENKHVLFQSDEVEDDLANIEQTIMLIETEYYIWSSGYNRFSVKNKNSDQE